MKKSIVLIALCLCVLGAKAQADKNVIIRCARGNVTYTDPTRKAETRLEKTAQVLGAVVQIAAGAATDTEQQPGYADAVSDAIAGAVASTYRIRVIDGNFLPEELDNDLPAIKYDGSISSISTTTRISTKEDEKGKKVAVTEYSGAITATINFKDARTDEIVKTININSSDYSTSWLASADKALGNVIDRMKSQIILSLNRSYPMYASIIEGNAVKKNKQKTVYIDLGSADGAYVNMFFTVYETGNVAGRETKREIGTLRIDEVMGADISLCKVKKGKNAIKSALDSGKTLLITSLD